MIIHTHTHGAIPQARGRCRPVRYGQSHRRPPWTSLARRPRRAPDLWWSHCQSPSNYPPPPRTCAAWSPVGISAPGLSTKLHRAVHGLDPCIVCRFNSWCIKAQYEQKTNDNSSFPHRLQPADGRQSPSHSAPLTDNPPPPSPQNTHTPCRPPQQTCHPETRTRTGGPSRP